MVKILALACSLLVPLSSGADLPGFDESLEAGLSLLQLRASLGSGEVAAANNTRVRVRDPSDNEREQCPHEIEAEIAAQGNYRYGCSGALRAQSTVKCSFWGEPHITALFPNGEIRGWDVLYKSGHFRLAAAADGSWEVQLFNCGVFAVSMAARFGRTLFESWIDSGRQIKYRVNGQEVNSLPSQIGEFYLDSTHRTIHTDGFRRAPAHFPGTCVDDPGGQVNIDVAQDLGPRNLNLRIEAASDAVTNTQTDPYSLCNIAGQGRGRAGWRWSNWPVQMIPTELSLFTIGDQMCAGCNAIMWDAGRAFHHGNSRPAAQNHCNAQGERDADDVVADSVCQAKNIAMADANAACAHLSENEQFFKDCKIDYCASDGQIVAAQEAENEEALENPQPVCVSDGQCDAAGDCCNALRDGSVLTLDNVVSSDMCSGAGVRYASALTQNGQVMDLVVRPVGEISCTGKLDNSKFGSRNSQIGTLGVLAGTEQAFEFTFVQHGTDNPMAPQNLIMSFLDLDQGRNNKQRESVEVCGAADAIVTDDTEVEVSVTGDCVKATSSTAGTGRDNPDNLEEMSQVQRARTVAYKIEGSTFSATLGVSRRGHNPRRFNFAGHPSVACVLKS
jgi:hypothetical protein